MVCEGKTYEPVSGRGSQRTKGIRCTPLWRIGYAVLRMDLPIVCTLTTDQRRERRLNVLKPIRNAAIKTEELSKGYSYTFRPQPDLLVRLAQLVDLERGCCRFLTFVIIADNETIRLEVTGPPDAKVVIADFFGTAT